MALVWEGSLPQTPDRVSFWAVLVGRRRRLGGGRREKLWLDQGWIRKLKVDFLQSGHRSVLC